MPSYLECHTRDMEAQGLEGTGRGYLAGWVACVLDAVIREGLGESRLTVVDSTPCFSRTAILFPINVSLFVFGMYWNIHDM